MLNRFKRIFPQARTIQSEREKRSTIRTLQTLLIISIAGDAAAFILVLVGGFGWQLALPMLGLLLIAISSLILLRRGVLLPARILLPITLFIAVTYIVSVGYGLHDINVLAYAIVIGLAGLTLGSGASFIFAFLIIASVFWIAYAETHGILVSPTSSLTLPISPFAISIVILAITFIQRALINLLNENVERARENERKQVEANRALEQERGQLEVRVSERTKDLQRRATQLRTAAEVANAAASIQDLTALLDQTVRLLNLRFGFYHAGIFLLDENGRFAVLRAANSEGGQKMLARGHKLEVGQVGIVGYVADKSEPRVALDVGTDAIYFNNPDLPNTRSEMALPLRIAGRVLGVLDLQSTEPLAFTNEDVETLQIVADQLAISIENARLLEESRAAVEATRRAFGEIAATAWKERFETETGIGFQTSERGTIALADTEAWTLEAREAAIEGKVVASRDRNTLYVPILVRGQTIGILKLVKPNQAVWTEAESESAEAIADQLSGALESARLFDNAQRRAAKEQALSVITSKISASINMRNVLQTAVEELGRAIPGSDVIIQFQTGNELERPEKQQP